MADKTSGVNAGPGDLNDSDLPAADPFAELTRIMGFDPRKAEGGTRTAAQASTAEDFKIDLEQELMREFGDEEPEPVSAQEDIPAFEEPLPEIAADAEEVEEVVTADEETEEAPVVASESAPVQEPAEAMMQAELASVDEADEEDIPVIRLSPVTARAEEPPAEAAPVLADVEPVDETELEAEFNALLGNQGEHEILDTSEEQLAHVAQTDASEDHAPVQPAVTMADAEEDLSVAFGFPEPEALDKIPEPEVEQIAESEEAEAPQSEEMAEAVEAAETEEVVTVAVEEDQPAAEVKAQEPTAAEEDDPFAMLAAMAQKYRVPEPNDSWRTSTPQYSRATPQISRATPQINRVEGRTPVQVEPQAPVVETSPARMEAPDPVTYTQAAAPVSVSVPEIETVDVPDRAVAMADDLDIPDIEVAEEPPVVSAADDLDAEFNNLLQQMSTPQAAPASQRSASAFTSAAPRSEPSAYQPQTAQAVPRTDYGQSYDAAAYRPQQAAAHHQPAPAQEAYRPAAPTSSYTQPTQSAARNYDERASYSQPSHQQGAAQDDDIRIDLTEDDLAEAFDEFDTAAMDDFDLDGDFEEDVAPAAYRQPPYQQPKRRGLLIAAIVGGVAILGVAGAVAMSMMGDAQGSAPELVKADQDPFKVRPENPGGTVAANQDSKVYETVARAGDGNASTQEKLISNSEEPIDLPDQLPDNADDDLAMVDDGAPKSEDRIQPSADAAQATDSDSLAVAPRKVRTMVVKPDGSLAPREEVEPQAQNDATPSQNESAAAPDDVNDEVANAIGTEPTPAETATVPAEVAQEQTASIAPQPVVEGGWTMQIASESSEEAAKATYQKMLGRYSKVLDGKGVNIMKADVAGKGTFWRIRIPAESRDAAASMCNSFKSAGGKCFVTKS